jgi:hypothetical protein
MELAGGAELLGAGERGQQAEWRVVPAPGQGTGLQAGRALARGCAQVPEQERGQAPEQELAVALAAAREGAPGVALAGDGGGNCWGERGSRKGAKSAKEEKKEAAIPLGFVFPLRPLRLCENLFCPSGEPIMSRLDRFTDHAIRYRLPGDGVWQATYCLEPAPHDRECVLYVADYDDFGEPEAEVRDLRLSKGSTLPLDLLVEVMWAPEV